MKFSVSKEEMQEKLSNIQNIVEKKNTMPILSHFLLSADTSGEAYITATDLETAIKEPIEIKIEEEGKICIPARKLFEIVREIEGDLLFETVDEQWIKIRGGTSEFRLACLPSNEFPAWPEFSALGSGEKIEEFKMDSSLLLEMIEKTIYSAGESDTRYTLNGLLFHTQASSSSGWQSLTVVGTDGHRLALIMKPLKGEVSPALSASTRDKKMIVPRKAVSELRRFLSKESASGGDVKISIGKNHLLFRISGVQFLTRLIEGTYPNYEQVIPQSNEKKIKLNREVFTKALRRVSVMSRERANAVRIDFGDNLLILSSINPDVGEAKEEVTIDYKGEKFTIGFNARYLIDSLSAMETENVMFEIQDPLSPALLREESLSTEVDGEYKCVIMPMRI